MLCQLYYFFYQFFNRKTVVVCGCVVTLKMCEINFYLQSENFWTLSNVGSILVAADGFFKHLETLSVSNSGVASW